MTVVVDASVAIKWVVEEDGSAIARGLIADEILVAPDFLIAECANVLRIKARRREMAQGDAEIALSAIQSAPVRLLPAIACTAQAQALAFETDQTVYDCLYLAAALAERAVLVTADLAFVEGVNRHGAYRSSIRPLIR